MDKQPLTALQFVFGCWLMSVGLVGMVCLWRSRRRGGTRVPPTMLSRAEVEAALLADDLVTADAVPPDMVQMPWVCVGPHCHGHETRAGAEFHLRTRHFYRDLAEWAQSGEPD